MKLKRMLLVFVLFGIIGFNGLIVKAATNTKTYRNFGASGTNAVAMAQLYGKNGAGTACIKGIVNAPVVKMYATDDDGNDKKFFDDTTNGEKQGGYPYTIKYYKGSVESITTEISEGTYHEKLMVRAYKD